MKWISIFFTAFILLVSCRKEQFITSKDATLKTSADTLFFDTVFTSIGSVTKEFKIINDNSQKLLLSKVQLMGGKNSSFKLNIDGVSGPENDNITIAANDSIYVFVQVNISPDASLLPFIITDSVLINYNGNNKYVQLQAYGQNAIYIKNKVLNENVVWTNTLPYVILGGLHVNAGFTLTINSGTRIFCHADAPVLIDGTLILNGTKNEPVIFKGDRLDADYKTLPAAWPGIFFRHDSKDNIIRFCNIQNAYQGLVLQDPATNANPKLTVSQTIIDNAYNSGILADNSSLAADNCLISNCGSNIVLQGGGIYNFTNCTVPSYSNLFIEHKNPVLSVSNSSNNVINNLNATFVNCIFWGDGGAVKDEITIDKHGIGLFQVSFDHNLVKLSKDLQNVSMSGTINNQDPLFDSINVNKMHFDFHFNKSNSSPAINSGVMTPFSKDLDDRNRANGQTDLGCYEK